jgi:hypothetical protein
MFLMVGWSLETLRAESEEKKQHFFFGWKNGLSKTGFDPELN